MLVFVDGLSGKSVKSGLNVSLLFGITDCRNNFLIILFSQCFHNSSTLVHSFPSILRDNIVRFCLIS